MTERRRARQPRVAPVRRTQSRRLDSTAWLWIGSGVLLVVVGILVAIGLYTEYYIPPRETVLKVGDRSFNMSYLVERTRYYIAESTSQGQLVTPSTAITTALDQIERDEFLRQVGTSEGLTVTDEEVDRTFREKMMLTSGRPLPQPSPAATPAPGSSPTPAASGSPTPTAIPAIADDDFKAALSDVKDRTNLSEGELREIARAEAILGKLRASLTASLPTTAPQVQLLTIVVSTKVDADTAKARLDAGEDFEKVQADVSPQTLQPALPAPSPTPAPGGTTAPPPPVQRLPPDWLPKELIRAPFADPAFATPVGRHSGIIESERGYLILKVLARDEARLLEPQQREFLVGRAVDRWITDRRDRLTVRRLLDAEKTEWALERVS